MTRLDNDLISRKALLEELKSFLSYSTELLNNNGHSNVTEFIESYHSDMERLITNAPTVQREGWVSVPIEPTSEMIDAAQWEDGKQTAINVYKLMVAAAPTDKE